MKHALKIFTFLFLFFNTCTAQQFKPAWSTFLGGSDKESGAVGSASTYYFDKQMIEYKNVIYSIGITNSINISTSDGSTFIDTIENLVLTGINKSSGKTIISKLVGPLHTKYGSWGMPYRYQIYGDRMYIIIPTNSLLFPTTDGSKYDGTGMSLDNGLVLYVYDLDALSLLYSKFIITNGPNYYTRLHVDDRFIVVSYINPDSSSNENFHLKIIDKDDGQLITNDEIKCDVYLNSFQYSLFSDTVNIYLMLLDNGGGKIIYKNYDKNLITKNQYDISLSINYYNGLADEYFSNCLLKGNNVFFSYENYYDLSLYSFDKLNNKLAKYKLGVKGEVLEIYSESIFIYVRTRTQIIRFNIDTKEIYELLNFQSFDSPVFYFKEGKFYVAGSTDDVNVPVTDGSKHSGGSDIVVQVFDLASGIKCYESYVGGSGDETAVSILPINKDNGCYDLILKSVSTSSDFPVTDGSSYHGEGDFVFTRLDISPDFEKKNILNPTTQSGCIKGYFEKIAGNIIQPNGCMVPEYRWEISTAGSSGPWTSIPDEFRAELVPNILSSGDKWYRRLVINPCRGDTVSISNPSMVSVDTHTAPSVDAGLNLITCLGTPVDIGGQPTAQGGTGTLTYSWTYGELLNDNLIPNPTATVEVPTVFTLTVVDEVGCKQIDQVYVNPLHANVGEDKSFCLGDTVDINIGSNYHIDPSISYQWTPSTNIECDDCGNTRIKTFSSGTYIQSQTIQLLSGESCTTKDTLVVNAISPPTPNFAGFDQVACITNPNKYILGLPSEEGFTYRWHPIQYLDGHNIDSSQVEFNSGNLIPNSPLNYTLTVSNGGCVKVDTIKVATIYANAGSDGCGPRLIGGFSGPQNSTYSWSVISGPNNIIGPLNTSTTTVLGSETEVSVYELTACYEGTCCSDRVVVGPCGCKVDIKFTSNGGCPSNTNDTSLVLTAKGSIDLVPFDSLIYTWSPCIGLDKCTGATVKVLDKTPRTYTVTISSPLSNLSCYDTILVNDPNFAAPIFEIGGDCFFGDSIIVGQDKVSGFNYDWNTNEFIKNPNTKASKYKVPLTDDPVIYSVVITDSQTGCYTNVRDTIQRSEPKIQLFNDVQVCPGSIAHIGLKEVPIKTYTYKWQPQNAAWVNGTDNTSAQPQVLAAIDMVFYVSITDPISGCVLTDSVSLDVVDLPDLPTSPDYKFCEGDSVKIGAEPVGGLKYLWSPADGLSCVDCAQPYATPQTNTTYTLIVQLEGSCIVTASDEINVVVNPLPVFKLEDIEKCPGTNIHINPKKIGECAGCSYEWKFINYLEDNTIINPLFKGNTNYLKTTNQFGCTYTDTMIVFDLKAPIPGKARSICLNESIQIGDPGNSALTKWAPDIYLDCNTCAEPTFTGGKAGQYILTCSKTIDIDGSSCTVADSIKIIVEDPKPDFPTKYEICKGVCTTIGPDPHATTLYRWIPSDGLSCADCAQPIICPQSDVNYTLITSQMNTETGCSAQTIVDVKVIDVPVPSLHIEDTQICQGEILQLIPEVSPNGNYLFDWFPNNGLDNINAQNPKLNSSIVPEGVHKYIVTVFDSKTGCGGIKDTILITVIKDRGTIEIVLPEEIDCATDTLYLDTRVTGDVDTNTLKWTTLGDGYFVFQQDKKRPYYVLGQLDSKYRYINVTCSAITKNCKDSISSDRLYYYLGFCCPKVCVNELAQSFCNELDYPFELDRLICQGTQPGSWFWTNGPGIVQPMEIADGIINPLNKASGIYTLSYVLDERYSGCLDSLSRQLIIENAPDAGLPLPLTIYCNNKDTLINISDFISGEDLTGKWSANNLSAESFDKSTGMLNLDKLSSGTYQIKYIVEGTSACPSDTAIVEIKINNAPSAKAGVDGYLDCLHDEVTIGDELNTGQNQSITWSTEDGIISGDPSDPTQSIVDPGTYVVIVSDKTTGCTSMDSVVVIERGTDISQISDINESAVCHDGKDGKLIVTEVDGGIAPYTYHLSGPVNETNLTGKFSSLPSGDYELLIEDSIGCTYGKEFILINPPAIPLTLTGDTIIHCNDTVIVNAVTNLNLSEIADITWYIGDNILDTTDVLTKVLSPSKSGVYKVKIKSLEGCEIETRFSIKLENGISYFAPNVFSPNYDGINDEFKLSFSEEIDKINTFKVFDRWGALMWEQNDISPHDSNFGWNGNYRNKEMIPGVYVWFAEYKGCRGETVLIKGDVTLVR